MHNTCKPNLSFISEGFFEESLLTAAVINKQGSIIDTLLKHADEGVDGLFVRNRLYSDAKDFAKVKYPL